jgi:hypothetical protein
MRHQAKKPLQGESMRQFSKTFFVTIVTLSSLVPLSGCEFPWSKKAPPPEPEKKMTAAGSCLPGVDPKTTPCLPRSLNCKFGKKTIADGDTVEAYPEEWAEKCVPEKRTCTQGVLSGNAMHLSCKEGPNPHFPSPANLPTAPKLQNGDGGNPPKPIDPAFIKPELTAPRLSPPSKAKGGSRAAPAEAD